MAVKTKAGFQVSMLMCPECGFVMLFRTPSPNADERFVQCRNEECKQYRIKFKWPHIELELTELEKKRKK